MDGLSAVSLDVASIATAQLASIQPQHKHPHPAMDAAAKLLGMSASDLRAALQGGQSLVSIASSKGISQGALVGAMATAIATRTHSAVGTPPSGPAPDAAAGANTSQAAGGTTATGRGHAHHRAFRGKRRVRPGLAVAAGWLIGPQTRPRPAARGIARRIADDRAGSGECSRRRPDRPRALTLGDGTLTDRRSVPPRTAGCGRCTRARSHPSGRGGTPPGVA